MLQHIVYVVATFGLGFGLGRIKNASKLAAIKAEIEKLSGDVSSEVKALAEKIKAKL